MSNAYYQASDFPERFAVFPLTGAPLFPRWQLPLNIFEPRYLNMIDDAMAGHRLIGMIQPFGGDRANPALAKVGCIGRITSFSETDDGRYMITLSGIARFRVLEEMHVSSPYRQVRASFAEFIDDLKEPCLENMPPRLRLETALQIYTDNNKFETDWATVEDAPLETLIHALATGCPFRPIEKQALIEAIDLKTRCDILIKLLSMTTRHTSHDDENGPLQ